MRDDRFAPVSVTEQDFSPPTHYRMIVRRRLNTPEKTVSTLQELPRLSQYDYELWVGKGTVRYLTREQLPNEVKSKLSMVMAASPKNFPRQFGYLFDSEIGAFFNAFTCPHEDVKYIGWRISESYLCLVISLNTLTQLQGG